jgi:ubiquinone/menaquinone biosynthesis C-methylase UbiE
MLDPENLEKIRQQFDGSPYPRTPLEKSPKSDYNLLFLHDITTPFYLRNQKVIDRRNKVILDVGCGSGYKMLALAEANPEAKIVGIDLSAQSIELAKNRLEFHGKGDRAEFFVMAIEDLPTLGMTFDYINCDDVLYLLDDLVSGLSSLKAVLNPQGLIRGNLHSSIQRVFFYRAQELFKMMGLMDENPGELEVGIVRDLMKSLKDNVQLKSQTWKTKHEHNEEWFFMNYLFQRDKGFTIPELFQALQGADLEFVSMVNWRYWEPLDLFQDADDLPAFLAMSLPELGIEDKLRFVELLHCPSRLLDFWCAHPDRKQPFVPIEEWTDAQWKSAKVHLHPQLRREEVRTDLVRCIEEQRPFECSKYLNTQTRNTFFMESTLVSCLLPLWEGAQTVSHLAQRALKTRPIDPVNLEPTSENRAFEQVKELLSSLEPFLYVLLENSA